MKKIFINVLLLFSLLANAQENMHPSPAQTNTIALTQWCDTYRYRTGD